MANRFDNSLYFTNYSLSRVASYFKSVKPFYSPINYGRRKVAQRMYEMLAKRGYVDVKNMDGDIYITTTEKGDEICNQLLQELVTFAQLSNIAPMMKEADLSHETYKVRKGVKGSFLRENANLKIAAEKLMEGIVEINSQFEEEMKDTETET